MGNGIEDTAYYYWLGGRFWLSCIDFSGSESFFEYLPGRSREDLDAVYTDVCNNIRGDTNNSSIALLFEPRLQEVIRIDTTEDFYDFRRRLGFSEASLS